MLHCPRRRTASRRRALTASCSLLISLTAGCFSEQSIRMDPDHAVRLPRDSDASPGNANTRTWLADTHSKLEHLLPTGKPEPLLTAQMTDPDGHPIDVFAHFGLDPAAMQSLLGNLSGIQYSAMAAARGYYIDRQAPPWPGFDDIWIPVQKDLALNARVGYARDQNGEPIDADCVVILPGLFGDHGVKRSRDLAIPLREAGYHVVHLELRGHGQTEARYPDKYHTFGVFETDDLMKVSDWLQALPHVRRTGLIGYCWTANIALLAAWYDGRSENDPMIADTLAAHLLPSDPDKHRFTAGVIAFSPVLRWEVLMDELDRPRSTWVYPIFAAIQGTIRDRMLIKNHPDPSGNLRQLVDDEYAGYRDLIPHGSADGYPFLRLLSYKGKPAGDKLESARIPVLIVHGADDPLVPSQGAADLIATVDNPNVAAIILPTGGHVGFAGYARDYYLSLILNFFDPAAGPDAKPAPPSAAP